MTLVVYPGADGSAALYEDDGKTLNYRGTDWMRIQLAWNNAARRLSIQLAPGSAMRPPTSRTFVVRAAGSQNTQRVTFAGRPVSVTVQP